MSGSSRLRSQWAVFGFAASAAVMAMGSGEEPAAKSGRGRVQQVSMAPDYPRATLKPVAAEGRVELERVLELQRQGGADRKVENVFGATSWYVPPPPPPAPPPLNLPPPQPTAPPLPFTYFGEYEDAGSGTRVIFLSSADRIYTVSQGDVIDGVYSVGAINGGQVEITYLPLNVKQSLNTGGAL